MDPGVRSPLVDFFRRGEVARDVRLLAASGAFAPRALEQLAILLILLDDGDPEIAAAAHATVEALPLEPLAAFLGRTDVPNEMREWFAARGVAAVRGRGRRRHPARGSRGAGRAARATGGCQQGRHHRPARRSCR